MEAGQYVHNPEWDLTPFQLWKRKQAAKALVAKVKDMVDTSDGNQKYKTLYFVRLPLTPSLSQRGRWSL